MVRGGYRPCESCDFRIYTKSGKYGKKIGGKSGKSELSYGQYNDTAFAPDVGSF